MKNQVSGYGLETIPAGAKPREVFRILKEFADTHDIRVVESDFDRPWGGFLVLDEDEIERFIELFFPDVQPEGLAKKLKMSPKFLAVAPRKPLSWQYHFRRSEIWRVVQGPLAVATSSTDHQPKPDEYQIQELIVLEKGQRHRLIGLDNWGIVAEIWNHTNPSYPSDESDIVRVQDDFGR